jgi:low temperature requirement protein LtrA
VTNKPTRAAGRFGLVRMAGRDRSDASRAATPLELFFDLVFVVAVSLASDSLHHLEAEGQVWSGLGAYAMVFFAIWWAWMNFVWFATAFDTDDWLYRVVTLIQMAGALIVAGGAGSAISHGDFTVVTIGYSVMTVAIAFQWFRAAADAPTYRASCLRHAVGVLIVQTAWITRLALPPDWGFAVFFVLVGAELAVPVIADRRVWTPSNPRHVAERYGLFTLIVLGETVLAATRAIVDGVDSDSFGPLVACAVAGLLTVACMWWLYFAAPLVQGFATFRSSFIYGYAHYFVFAAAGAVSAGLEIAADSVRTSEYSANAAVTLTLPVLVFILLVWALALRRLHRRLIDVSVGGTSFVLATSTFTSTYLWACALALICLTGIVVVSTQRSTTRAAELVALSTAGKERP